MNLLMLALRDIADDCLEGLLAVWDRMPWARNARHAEALAADLLVRLTTEQRLFSEYITWASREIEDRDKEIKSLRRQKSQLIAQANSDIADLAYPKRGE